VETFSPFHQTITMLFSSLRTFSKRTSSKQIHIWDQVEVDVSSFSTSQSCCYNPLFKVEISSDKDEFFSLEEIKALYERMTFSFPWTICFNWGFSMGAETNQKLEHIDRLIADIEAQWGVGVEGWI
jgi:hypothetical protein